MVGRWAGLLGRMSTRVAYLAVLLLVGGVAHSDECSPMEAYAAETVVDYLDNWANLHRAYSQFAKCDDGAIAEGFSDVVTKLLSRQWRSLPDLTKIIGADPTFEQFVLRHLDETVSAADLKAIATLATSSCPRGARGLCERIRAHIDELGKG